MKNMFFGLYYYYMVHISSSLLIIIISFFLASCASQKYATYYVQALENNLEQVDIKYEKNFDSIKKIEILQYSSGKVTELNNFEQGNADAPGKLIHKIRKQFSIVDLNDFSIDAEALFIYTRDGFLLNSPKTAMFYGKTAKADLPFTISLVADPQTHVFSGKSIHNNYLLEIKGDEYFYQMSGKHNTETGFAIYHKDKIVALFNRFDIPTLFMSPNIVNNDLRKTIVFTVIFLAMYERSSRYMIN